jgi:hypothetical protein
MTSKIEEWQQAKATLLNMNIKVFRLICFSVNLLIHYNPSNDKMD